MKWKNIIYRLPGGLLAFAGLLLLFAGVLLVLYSGDMSKTMIDVPKKIEKITSSYIEE